MKYLKCLTFTLGIMALCQNPSYAQEKPLSPHTSATAMVGGAHIHIDYSSPGVRGRTIFGGLLPYGKVWVAGAGDATWIEFNKDLIINGEVLPAGKYGLFVIPDTDNWTLIFNTQWNQHGTKKYDAKKDVLRMELTPQPLNNLVEHLEYKVTSKDSSTGTIALLWAKTKVELPIKIKDD